MEKEAEGDEGNEGNEESVVPVHLRVRRYPEPTLGRDRYCYGSCAIRGRTNRSGQYSLYWC